MKYIVESNDGNVVFDTMEEANGYVEWMRVVDEYKDKIVVYVVEVKETIVK